MLRYFLLDHVKQQSKGLKLEQIDATLKMFGSQSTFKTLKRLFISCYGMSSDCAVEVLHDPSRLMFDQLLTRLSTLDAKNGLYMLKTLNLLSLPETMNPYTYLNAMWPISQKHFWIWKRVYEKQELLKAADKQFYSLS